MLPEHSKLADALAGVQFGPAQSIRIIRQDSTSTVSSSTSTASTIAYSREDQDVDGSPQQIVVVPVRLSGMSAQGLPPRPSARSFLSRTASRLLQRQSRGAWKVMKMPRGEYKRYFIRTASGEYAGTEPQQLWDEWHLMERYGMYQDLPMGSLVPSYEVRER